MSDNDNQPPFPSKQTSSVPLKKETVRVTLKAADAPPAVPNATVPLVAPARPPIPGGPPIVSAPVIPINAPPRPPMAPSAPTVPLRTGPPAAGVPAPTIRLASSPSAPARPGAPLPTSPGFPKPAGAPTVGLPRATMQLQPPTQPMGTGLARPQASSLQASDDEEVEEEGSGLLKILSGVGLVAALVVLILQLMVASQWINSGGDENPRKGEWSQLMD